MRYERKYRIENNVYDQVYHELMSNSLGFKEAFPNRFVNSIYYDDVNFTSYNDNLLGIGDRTKYRVRWYGKSLEQIKQPILEKKIKQSQLGRKVNTPLQNFNLSCGAPELSHLVSNHLFPYIIVRYNRSYLVSSDELIRATIDQDLQYIHMMNGKVTSVSNTDEAIILEIKYDQGNETLANECMQGLPYRMTKNSKYVSGMKFYLH